MPILCDQADCSFYSSGMLNMGFAKYNGAVAKLAYVHSRIFLVSGQTFRVTVHEFASENLHFF